MSREPSASSRLFSNPLRCWLILLGLQCIVASAIYFEFIFGRKYFAFSDIGGDTYFQFIPIAMHLANYLASEGFPGWSFQVGLGASLGPLTDPFLLLSTVFGPQAVPELRIWFYLLKIACGGGFFLYGLLALDVRREAAVVSSLAYSFCGYILIDGQWDPLATEFVFYALLFWALAHHNRHRGVLFLPLAVAAAAASGNFMPFTIGVFLAYVFIAQLIVSDNRDATSRRWLLEIWPLALLGIVLAAPIIIPNVFQLLDSPRVSGAQSMYAERLKDLLSLNDSLTILAELAGFWHKNLLGIGNDYHGWMNYLEGPGFYVGVLPLLLIPQLWRGSRRDRAWLKAGLALLAFYILSPFLRFAAFGFGLTYFRLSTLWVAMLLLVLSARALSIVLDRGVDRILLRRTAVVPLVVLCIPAGVAYFESILNVDHLVKVLVLYGLAFVLLSLGDRHVVAGRSFVVGLLALAGLDAMLIGWTGVNENRIAVTARNFGYADDTLGALRSLKSADPGFYRIEKTYQSLSMYPVALCDSLAQGYFGVKSYYFHGSGIVDFHIGVGLIPASSGQINYTNWLPGLGERYALYSLLGVKYVISRTPLSWPGFEPVAGHSELSVYRNEFALPLGIVQERQYPRERFAQLPAAAKDLMLMNAAIVERPLDGIRLYDERNIDPDASDRLEKQYAGPARRHQRSGLRVESFSHRRIVGRIEPGSDGILVFSIPDAPGWTVRVDGRETPTFRANLGMLAVRVGAGAHTVELDHQQLGRGIGFTLSALALLVLLFAWRISIRRGPAG